MDVLSDVLETVRFNGTVFAVGDFGAPFGIRAVAVEQSAFHIVMRGQCWLEVEGRRPVQLEAGDIVVLPGGATHALKDHPRSPSRPLGDFLAAFARSAAGSVVRWGGRGATARVACGCFQFDDRFANPLLAVLPEVIHVRENVAELAPWLASTIQLIAHESATRRPGAETVINRLSDALFVYVLRKYLAATPEGKASWLRALGDWHIAAALGLIHGQPREDWTVARLAKRVGLSRSAFAARFVERVGETPLQYVLRWRLHKAAALLRNEPDGLGEIAAAAGYQTEAAFNKAFKRVFGIAPGAYRRRSVDAAVIPLRAAQ